ncbi:MAG TPA: glucose-6-phosphate isomerase [Caulobacteraceae bacterium]|nr:glucose-6-phosphate isomerase [Caulobacteraceae bacterium]
MSSTDEAWVALEAAAKADGAKPIKGLFDAEPDRLTTLTLEAAGLSLDLSKQPWSRASFGAALALARAADIEGHRARLFAGEMVNRTEKRPALHMALRAPDGAQYMALGKPISPEVEATRAQMRDFAGDIRAHRTVGATGKPFRSIVHIGIGGSDLGPKLVWEALKPLDAPIEIRFAANIDGAEIAAALAGLDPAETLVIVVSKSFTTEETLVNGNAARTWLAAALGEAGANAHLAAVSANVEGAKKFGVPEERIFAFWDWVGGRYSLWSAVGLSCAVALGWDVFAELLAGAAAMDEHFRAAPLERSAPALLALAHVFNRNGLGRPIRAVVPYARRLALLPAFLQQLEMESNGKQVDEAGAPVAHGTASAVFGDAGTTGQHAFFQMLHQGTTVIPVDIVTVAAGDEGPPGHQARLLANAIAQAEALMIGQANTAEPWRNFPGDRPTAFVLLPRLTPTALGALIALYEHKVFVEGVLWGIDSFDQWGVELGKTLAKAVFAELQGGAKQPHDPSTTALIARLGGGNG